MIGLAAAIISAGLMAGCGSNGDSSTSENRTAPDLSAPADSASTTGGESVQTLPSATDRKIKRTATLELSVEDVGKSVQSIDAIAAAAGGFVSGSSVFVDDQSSDASGGAVAERRSRAGTMTIRVPADAYESVVSQLRGIAKDVVSEKSDAAEVTEEYTDLQARLRNLQATENQYLELLKKAVAIPDILTVQDRLNSVRLEIEQAQGRINVLNDLTDLATITVKLNVPPLVVEDEGWVQKAWDASLAVAETAMMVGVTVAIFGGVSLLWVVPVVLVLALVWKLFTRRIASSLHRLLSAS